MFDNDKTEIDVKISLMNFIHYDVSVASQRVWIVDQPLKKDTGRHEKNPGHSWCLASSHTYMVTHCLPDFFTDLLRDAFGYIHSSDSPWLGTDDLHLFVLSK